MRLDQAPLYRKEIVPWWDSDFACILLVLFNFIVFLFGLTGITVAHESIDYRSSVWVPALLSALSGIAMASTITRMIHRYLTFRNKSDYP